MSRQTPFRTEALAARGTAEETYSERINLAHHSGRIELFCVGFFFLCFLSLPFVLPRIHA